MEFPMDQIISSDINAFNMLIDIYWCYLLGYFQLFLLTQANGNLSSLCIPLCI